MIEKLMKNVETTTNKIRIPKYFVKKNGRNYSMEIYEDKIILIPIRKEN